MKIIPAPLERLQMPWCDRCGKVVDAIERKEDFTRQTIIFVAYCHGEHELAELTRAELEDRPVGMRGALRFGAAFTTKRLPSNERSQAWPNLPTLTRSA